MKLHGTCYCCMCTLHAWAVRSDQVECLVNWHTNGEIRMVRLNEQLRWHNQSHYDKSATMPFSSTVCHWNSLMHFQFLWRILGSGWLVTPIIHQWISMTSARMSLSSACNIGHGQNRLEKLIFQHKHIFCMVGLDLFPFVGVHSTKIKVTVNQLGYLFSPVWHHFQGREFVSLLPLWLKLVLSAQQIGSLKSHALPSEDGSAMADNSFFMSNISAVYGPSSISYASLESLQILLFDEWLFSCQCFFYILHCEDKHGKLLAQDEIICNDRH